MQFGTLPYDVAHLLGGVVLVLSFVLLTQRRVPAVINAYAAQAAALSLAGVPERTGRDRATVIT